MTCQHCCGAERIFDNKTAVKDHKKYNKKGPNKTTRLLLKFLNKTGVKDKTLLDIGGGVGVIQHEFLKSGGARTLDVDASLEYIEENKKISGSNGRSEQMDYIYGDFIDVHDQVSMYDIVTLERVVCCYPDMNTLLSLAASKSSSELAFVYPGNNILSRLFIFFGNTYLKLTKNAFRTFVHSEKQMLQVLEDSGFEKVEEGIVFPWKVVKLKRIEK